MSQKTRGAIQMIMKSFVASFKPQPKPKFMGEDYLGTKYYEEPRESGRKTRGRFFLPRDAENFEQEVPAEWESWLRYRRKIPPTEEEIEESCRIIKMKRENAAKLEKEYSKDKDKNMLGKGDKPSGMSFPVYEEYSSGFQKK